MHRYSDVSLFICVKVHLSVCISLHADLHIQGVVCETAYKLYSINFRPKANHSLESTL